MYMNNMIICIFKPFLYINVWWCHTVVQVLSIKYQVCRGAVSSTDIYLLDWWLWCSRSVLTITLTRATSWPSFSTTSSLLPRLVTMKPTQSFSRIRQIWITYIHIVRVKMCPCKGHFNESLSRRHLESFTKYSVFVLKFCWKENIQLKGFIHLSGLERVQTKFPSTIWT